MTASFYRKRPVVIEAMQLTTGNGDAVADGFCAGTDAGYDPRHQQVWIRTLEGIMRADVGDYVIRGIQGELYPCKPQIFEATYEAVEEET